MAKGKKASGKNYTSKGERRSSIKTRGVGITNAEKMLRKLDALAKGKDVKITLENPNKTETNRKFISYRVSGKAYQKYMQGGSEMKGSKNPLFNVGD